MLPTPPQTISQHRARANEAERLATGSVPRESARLDQSYRLHYLKQNHKIHEPQADQQDEPGDAKACSTHLEARCNHSDRGQRKNAAAMKIENLRCFDIGSCLISPCGAVF